MYDGIRTRTDIAEEEIIGVSIYTINIRNGIVSKYKVTTLRKCGENLF
jgi:hypothetical protein